MFLDSVKRKRYREIFYRSVGVLVWAFVGAERLVGDHEAGIIWEPFVKQRASLQIRFSDPSRRGLESVPFTKLNHKEQVQLIAFCDIRYGVRDPTKCHRMILARNV